MPVPGSAPEPAGNGRRLGLDVHARLRSMILSGQLAPGSVLLQAQLARDLGVSRTPMREAFRLLHEEGLIDAQPDQRARVRAFDPADLDSVYGARIMLETLAVSVTVRHITAADLELMTAALRRMEEHAHDEHIDDWHRAHREFHRLTAQGVGDHLLRELDTLAEHCERYVRLAQLGSGQVWPLAHRDHIALLAAFRAADHDNATEMIGRHLARTAMTVLADVAPHHEPVVTRTALRLGIFAGGEPSGDLRQPTTPR